MRAKDIAEILLSKSDDVIELDDAIPKILGEHLGFSDLEACEKSDELLPKVISSIDEELKVKRKKGLTPKYIFSKYDDHRLIGRSKHSKLSDKIKRRFECQSEVLEFLQTLGFREFEVLCALIIQKFGAEKVGVTKKTGEGGVDFFGVYPLADGPGYGSFLYNVEIKIIGESKRRSGPIQKNDIDHFLNNFKRAFRGDEYLHSVPSYISGNTLFPIFMTSSRFQSGARKIAEKNDLYLRDGEQLSEDIIRLFGGFFEDTNSEPIFCGKKFENMIASSERKLTRSY